MIEKIEKFIQAIDYEQVSVIYGDYVNAGSDWNLTKHKHKVLEIIYLTEANATIMGIDQKIQSTWCDVIIYPAGVWHQEYVDVRSKQKCMYIWIDVKSEVAIDEVFTLKDINGKIRWLMNELVELAGIKDTSKEALAKGYVRGLFENIKENSQREKENIDLIEQVVRYMQHHYMEDLSVERLSKIFYIDASYLSRLFKKKLQYSPIQYLTNIRIENAKKLLKMTNLTINEVAEQVGIMDSKYFSRMFKKHTQQTPLEFKKSQKSPLLTSDIPLLHN